MKLGAVTEDEQQENGLEHVDAVDPNLDPQNLDPVTGEKAKPVDPLIAENKRLQKDAKDARKLAKENDETARYWAEQARHKPAPAAVVEVDPADELGEVDLVDEISTKGVKGLDALLKKLGYAKTNDVANAIGQTRAEITDQASLLTAYPDLGDADSPFFKATAKIFNSLKTDPHMAKSPKLIATAARLAKAEMGNAPRRKAAPDPDEDGGEVLDDDELDDSHANRVARQSGDRGRGSRRNDDAPVLSALQKKMVAQFAAVGAPVTEENYLKRAMSGSIRMGGRGGR